MSHTALPANIAYLLTGTLLALHLTEAVTVLHVSPAGSSNGTCIREPCSIQHALALVETTAVAQISLEAGRYQLSSSLAVTAHSLLISGPEADTPAAILECTDSLNSGKMLTAAPSTDAPSSAPTSGSAFPSAFYIEGFSTTSGTTVTMSGLQIENCTRGAIIVNGQAATLHLDRSVISGNQGSDLDFDWKDLWKDSSEYCNRALQVMNGSTVSVSATSLSGNGCGAVAVRCFDCFAAVD